MLSARFRLFVFVFVSLTTPSVISGCGGASAGGSSGSGDGADGLGADQGPVDEEAKQADLFCKHEIEKSEVQPPDALSRKQIMACLLAIRPTLNGTCAKGPDREVVLKIIVDKTGDVSGAFPVGDAADSPEASCVAEKVKEVTFPKFKGSTQQVIKKFPFKLKK